LQFKPPTQLVSPSVSKHIALISRQRSTAAVIKKLLNVGADILIPAGINSNITKDTKKTKVKLRVLRGDTSIFALLHSKC
jgi:hypothetical protein